MNSFISFLLSVVAFITINAEGASTLWNRGFALEWNQSWGVWHVYWDWPDESDRLSTALHPTVDLSVSVDPDSGLATVSSDGLVNAGYGYNWVALEAGDVAGASTTRNQDAYFLLGWIDWQPGDPTDDIGRTDYAVSVPGDGQTPFYLACATEYSAGGGELPIVYGWIELFAGRDNSLRLGNTAIDLSGAPLTVGQVPEPGAGCLAAVGAAFLALAASRRRRRTA